MRTRSSPDTFETNDPGSSVERAAPGHRALTERLPARADHAARPPIQTKASASGTADLGPMLDAAVRPDLFVDRPAEQVAPSGHGLDGPVRGKMERAFAADFSNVTVEDRSSAAADMGARAFARGDELHFAPGQYDPGSTPGQELIGHELTHVVQQRAGRVGATTQAKGEDLNDDPSLEAEADDLGARAARGEIVSTSPGPGPSASRSSIVQGKLDDARAYAKRHLGISTGVDTHWVQTYVEDTDKPRHHRRGLLVAFNRGNSGRWALPTPHDLDESNSSSSESDSDEHDNQLSEERSPPRTARRRAPTSEKKQQRNTRSRSPKPVSEHRGERKMRNVRNKTEPVPDPFRPSSEIVGQYGEELLIMGQFGGGTGSYAGDSMALSANRSRRMFSADFGTGEQRQAASKFRKAQFDHDPSSSSSEWEDRRPEEDDDEEMEQVEYQAQPKRSAMLTHSHKDHVGQPSDYKGFDLFVGESAPDIPNTNAVHHVDSDDEPMFEWFHPDSGVGVSGDVIRPDIPRNPKDENARSLGALIKIDQVTETDPHSSRLFTFLSLGDMTPHEAHDPIQGAMELEEGPPDLLKLPHHGSKHNIGAVPDNAVGPNTTILISGYTMTDTTKLAQFLGSRPHGQVFMLFQRREDALQLVQTAAWQKLAAQGVTLARDYFVVVDRYGNVTKEASGWK